MLSERRSSPRLDADVATATVFHRNQSWGCTLLDVSSSGLGLRCRSREKPGVFIKVRFAVPGSLTSVTVDAVLVRRRQVDFEFEWGVQLLSGGFRATLDVIDAIRQRPRLQGQVTSGGEENLDVSPGAARSASDGPSAEQPHPEKWWLAETPDHAE